MLSINFRRSSSRVMLFSSLIFIASALEVVIGEKILNMARRSEKGWLSPILNPKIGAQCLIGAENDGRETSVRHPYPLGIPKSGGAGRCSSCGAIVCLPLCVPITGTGGSVEGAGQQLKYPPTTLHISDQPQPKPTRIWISFNAIELKSNLLKSG